MNLKQKSDETLITDLKELVVKERQLLTEILHYLKEVEDRRLYLEWGYSNVYDFGQEELGYSESAIHRRVQTMRLIKEVPQVEKKIEKGEMSLTVAAQIQCFVRKENKKRKEEKEAPISKAEKLELVKKLEGTSARSCEKKLIQMAPETALPKEKTRPLTEEKTLIQFVADKKLMDKIEKLKALLSHQNIEGRYDKLFEKAVDMALNKLDPEKRIEKRGKRAMKRGLEEGRTPAPVLKPKSRYIPQTIKDQIWRRDHGRCQYTNHQTGKICGSKYALTIEHLRPYALGGDHQQDNLQLLCRAHNQHKARKVFGEVYGMR